MNDPLRQETELFLAAHHVLSLATNGPDGVWAAAVFYVHDGFNFYFLSAEHTRHGRNLAIHPHAAGTIQQDQSSWAHIKGIQLAGPVHILQGGARLAAFALYTRKYPFLQQAPPPMRAAMEKVNLYQLTALELHLVDNSKGFGHRDQLLPASDT